MVAFDAFNSERKPIRFRGQDQDQGFWGSDRRTCSGDMCITYLGCVINDWYIRLFNKNPYAEGTGTHHLGSYVASLAVQH